MTNNQMQVAQQNQAVQQMPKTLADRVQIKVRDYQNNGDLIFPENYSPDNALKSAWLILQNTKNISNAPVLQACTQDSIANTLLEMVVQGLDPVKKQCYFIAYGNQLTLQRSYFGTMAVTKRVAGAKEINAMVVYEGDNVTYDIENGRIYNLKHSQAFGNINKENIIGAYCIIRFEDGTEYTEIMTIDEIRQSWGQSKMKKNQNNEGGTHEKFRQEMAKKTVINRACKKFLNSSSNADLMVQYMNKSDDRIREVEVLQEIQQNANQIPLDIAPEPQQLQQPVNMQTGEILEAEPVYVSETLQQQPHVTHPDMYEQTEQETLHNNPNGQMTPGADTAINDGDPFE